MKLGTCFSLLSGITLIVACGGSTSSSKDAESIPTRIPDNGKTWSSTTAAGTAPPTSDTTTSAGVAANTAPAVAPQAAPPQAVPAGPCDACKGPVSSDLQGALNKRAEQARKCYERVLTNNPAARASMGIEVRVGRDGSSCDALVKDAEQPEWPGLADCVVTEFRRGGFPANSSCVVAKVPILFTPKVSHIGK